MLCRNSPFLMFAAHKSDTTIQHRTLQSKHVYLHNQNIKDLSHYSLEKNASHLYLYGNKLITIKGIQTMKFLTHLYLQWNNIETTDNLNDLPNLTYLYLGYNKITHLTGLHGMKNLRLLHIQHQRLSLGSLTIDETTCSELSASLKELNISGNGLRSLISLQTLTQLENLNMADNLITNLKETCNILHEMKNLIFLDIRNNPITKYCRYKEELIACLNKIEKINDIDISVQTRIFIHEMNKRKEIRAKKSYATRVRFSAETQRLAPHLPVEFREIVSQSTIHERKCFNKPSKNFTNKSTE